MKESLIPCRSGVNSEQRTMEFSLIIPHGFDPFLSSSMSKERILFRDRPEWKDVVPVKQDDGPDPVAPISYSQECFCI